MLHGVVWIHECIRCGEERQLAIPILLLNGRRRRRRRRRRRKK
jgi:hypothetical protein